MGSFATLPCMGGILCGLDLLTAQSGVYIVLVLVYFLVDVVKLPAELISLVLKAPQIVRR